VNKIGVTSDIVISPLQFRQISVIGTMERASLELMIFPFAQTNVGGEQTKVHPGSGACRSEKQELKLARSLCDSGSITNYRAPIIRKSRGKNERTFAV
jgi:hypothetical protein